MNVRTSRLGFVLLVLALLALPGLGARALAEPPVAERALALVAAREGLDAAQLEILALDERQLVYSGERLSRAKVYDAASDHLFEIALDASGVEVDFAAALDADAQRMRSEIGAMHPDLARGLASLPENATIEVGIWVATADYTPLPRPDTHVPGTIEYDTREDLILPAPERTEIGSEEQFEGLTPAELAQKMDIADEQALVGAEIEAWQAANDTRLHSFVAVAQAPVLATLDGMGLQPSYVSPNSPLIYVTVDRATLEVLARDPAIDTIYPPTTDYRDLMEIAKTTQKADIVDDFFGYDGSGVDVAILEDSRVQYTNPFLAAGNVRVPADANVDNHATATAGMVASLHGTTQGIAQGAQTHSANATTYGNTNLSNAMDWAAAGAPTNIEIINNSWGGNTGTTNLNEHDRHLDWIVRNSTESVTVAAGNEGPGCGGNSRVGSPARAYNVISVGNYNDGNTLTWDDDVMSTCSSTIDPSTGTEKPEVAASGSSIRSTIMNSPWIANAGSGTSFAAPMVAGELALMMERNASLFTQPEAAKAIVIATALNNIEGSSRLSEADGAGGVDMRAAFRVVDEGWWQWENNTTPADYDIEYSYYLFAGETVRAAIAWDSNPNGSYTTDPLDADLDLRVYNPSNAYVTGSTSFNNSYEIVEFTAATSGVYDFRISDYRFDGTSEDVGFALWPGHRVMTNYINQNMGTPPVSRDYFRIESAGHWTAQGIRSPAGANYNIYLYDESAFGDPEDHDWLEDSTLLLATIDYVVIDGNHAPSKDYFTEVRAVTGTGSYVTEWGNYDSVASPGTHGPFAFGTADILRVFDLPLTGGQATYIAARPTSGGGDIGMTIHDSNPASAASYYQGRSQRVIDENSAGAGGDEVLSYTAASSDVYGLVVYQDSSTAFTNYMLYVDDSAPTGSIAIDGGAAATSTTAVTLNLSASDPQTGVMDMRFSNNGTSWTAWQPYATSRAWNLPAGDGGKRVYVQYRNNAGMVSERSDTIRLDTIAPTSSASSPATAPSTFTVSWSGSDATSGIASYDVQYRVGAGGWTGWLNATASTSATFGPTLPGSSTPVQIGESYSFRVRARDQAGNLEAYPGGAGDTTTQVQGILFVPMLTK